MTDTVTPVPPKSPSLPTLDGEPLVFKLDWLKPVVNDVHSKSRLQCLMLSFLRVATSHLSKTPREPWKDNVQWKHFLDQLKVLTALDVCQPRPLRAALARLWVVYLCTGETTLIITAASWLLEQLCNLYSGKSVPIQAVVFIECSRAVFPSFLKLLQPTAQDCVIHLIKILQMASSNCQNSNYVIVTSVSQTLAQLTATEVAFMDGKTVAELGQKVAIPQLDTPHASIRCCTLQILFNLFESHNFALGSIARKNLRSKVESLLASPCKEEVDLAASLLSLMLSCNPTDNSKLVSPEKLAVSWIKLADRLPLHSEALSSQIICSSSIFLANPIKVLEVIMAEHALSFALVPESKKKYWRLSPDHLNAIMERLRDEPKSDLPTIMRSLLKLKVSSQELAFSLHSWYLRLAATGYIQLSESEIMSRCVDYVSMEISRETAKALPSIASNAERRLSLSLFIFAQLKGEWNMSIASGVPPSFERLTLLALCLRSLIAATDPQSIFRTPELWLQIKEWADVLHSSSEAQSIDWQLYSAIITVTPNIINLDNLGAELEAKGPLPPTKPIESEKTLKPPLPLGELLFVQAVLSSTLISPEKQSAFTARITHFIGGIWRYCAQTTDIDVGSFEFELLCQVTLSLPPADGLIDVAASMSSRIICNSPETHRLSPVLSYCREIITLYFKTASVASQKYHLSQFKLFVESVSVRKNIFTTLHMLLGVLSIGGKSPDDASFILETCKHLIFPFVCDRDEFLQSLASECLARLVELVGSIEFRDAMLQELIDRALNEQKEENRRGYILGIGQVFASLPESKAHFDINSVVGILSSLAKDPRSLIVQSSALRALQHAVEARRNPVTTVLSIDTVYLVWQIYMSDLTALPIGSATENIVFDSICGTLSVLSEIIGPELGEDSTIARICRLMMAELLEGSVGKLSPGSIRHVLSAAMQIVTVIKSLSNDVNVSAIASTAFYLIKQTSNSGDVEIGIKCLSWMLQFYFEETIKLINKEFFADLFQLKGVNCKTFYQDLRFCQDLIFKQSFSRDPLTWLKLLQDSKLLKATGHRVTTSSVSLDQDVSLLQSMSIEPVGAAEAPTAHLESLSSITLVADLIMDHLDRFKGTLWTPATNQQFLGDFVRLSLALTMLPSTLRESHQLKSLGIRMMCRLIGALRDLPDPLDQDSSLLDLYYSQIISVFSTAAQDDDLLVASESLAAFIRLLSLPNVGSRLSSHSKVKNLILKGFSLLTNADALYPCDKVKTFCRLLLCEALLRLWHPPQNTTGVFEFSASQKQVILNSSHKVLSTSAESLIDGGLVGREVEILPAFLFVYLSSNYQSELRSAQERRLVDSSALALVLVAPISIQSISVMSILVKNDAALVKEYWEDLLVKVLESNDPRVLTSFLKSIDSLTNAIDDDWVLVAFEVVSKLLQLEVDQTLVVEAVAACQGFKPLFALLLFALVPILTDSVDDGALDPRDVGRVIAGFEFKDELHPCLLVFGPRNLHSLAWKLQFATSIIAALRGEGPTLLSQYATMALRRLLESDPPEGARCFSLVLKSNSAKAKEIALNCLDLVIKKGIALDADHMPPGPHKACALQL